MREEEKTEVSDESLSELIGNCGKVLGEFLSQLGDTISEQEEAHKKELGGFEPYTKGEVYELTLVNDDVIIGQFVESKGDALIFKEAWNEKDNPMPILVYEDKIVYVEPYYEEDEDDDEEDDDN